MKNNNPFNPPLSKSDNKNEDMPKDLKRWLEIRKGGQLRFIFVSGVLSYGLPMFVLMTFVVNGNKSLDKSIVMILISLVIWAIGGSIFGYVMWKFTENKYQKYLIKIKSAQQGDAPETGSSD